MPQHPLTAASSLTASSWLLKEGERSRRSSRSWRSGSTCAACGAGRRDEIEWFCQDASLADQRRRAGQHRLVRAAASSPSLQQFPSPVSAHSTHTHTHTRASTAHHCGCQRGAEARDDDALSRGQQLQHAALYSIDEARAGGRRTSRWACVRGRARESGQQEMALRPLLHGV